LIAKETFQALAKISTECKTEARVNSTVYVDHKHSKKPKGCSIAIQKIRVIPYKDMKRDEYTVWHPA